MKRLAPLAALVLPLAIALAARGAPLGATAPHHPLGAAARAAGKALFLRKGCVACHTLDGDSAAVGTMGPDLSGLGQKMTASRLGRYIADPQAFDATTSMPQLDLSPSQIALLAAFILTPPPTPTPMPTPRPRPTPSSLF